MIKPLLLVTVAHLPGSRNHLLFHAPAITYSTLILYVTPVLISAGLLNYSGHYSDYHDEF